ncbi:MAG: ribonuclease P protein component [Proteobacteria bacterium]|nr:ribonuclease P protein component [Pseudomonadota bacterium]
MQEEQKAEKDCLLKRQHSAAFNNSVSTQEKFPKGSRILTQETYAQVFKQSKRIQDKYFSVLIHYDKAINRPKVGLVVSRKVDKKAVQRNRLKRLIRESFRRRKKLKKAAYVVIAKQAASLIENQVITTSLDELWKQLEKKNE